MHLTPATMNDEHDRTLTFLMVTPNEGLPHPPRCPSRCGGRRRRGDTVKLSKIEPLPLNVER